MPVSFMDWLRYFAAALLPAAAIAYLCGCFNGAVIVSKYILRDDVRSHGSGNAGLTNFYRTFGGFLTLMVILTDVLKAVAALLLAGMLVGGIFGQYWAGLFCLLGHMFPCMFHFKGGKVPPSSIPPMSSAATALRASVRMTARVSGPPKVR